jgi:putative RNA 2'-phosphotransferase
MRYLRTYKKFTENADGSATSGMGAVAAHDIFECFSYICDMNSKQLSHKGRYMSKLLRHDPEDLTLSKDGYVSVSSLLDKLDLTKEELDWIIDNNNKKRFAYNKDETLIRASQGHNKKLKVEVDMEEAPRVEVLYHGTVTSSVDSIMKSGLKPLTRNHVHLSIDEATAINVGSRKGKDITILKIDSARMRGDGIKIWLSDNKVHLTDYVDPKYISHEKSKELIDLIKMRK